MTYAVLQVKWQGLGYLIDLQVIVLTRQKDNVGLTAGVYYYGRCITVNARSALQDRIGLWPGPNEAGSPCQSMSLFTIHR